MNHALKAALIRGAIGGAIAAGAAFFAMAPTQGAELAFYASGSAFFGFLALRVAEAQVSGDTNKPDN